MALAPPNLVRKPQAPAIGAGWAGVSGAVVVVGGAWKPECLGFRTFFGGRAALMQSK